MLSPDEDGGGQKNWGHHKAEVDPPFIRFDGLGYREQVDDDPQSRCKTQCQPDEVAGGLVYGPKGLALGSADAHCYCHERTHEQRSETDGQYSQADRDFGVAVFAHRDDLYSSICYHFATQLDGTRRNGLVRRRDCECVLGPKTFTK
jgi:hypothetical protein